MSIAGFQATRCDDAPRRPWPCGSWKPRKARPPPAGRYWVASWPRQCQRRRRRERPRRRLIPALGARHTMFTIWEQTGLFRIYFLFYSFSLRKTASRIGCPPPRAASLIVYQNIVWPPLWRRQCPSRQLALQLCILDGRLHVCGDGRSWCGANADAVEATAEWLFCMGDALQPRTVAPVAASNTF